MTILAALALGFAAAAPAQTPAAAPRAIAALPVARVAIVARHPHDPGAFTEGLLFRDGHLFESTGLEGQSTVRQVRIADGRVLRRRDFPDRLFGEGIIDWKDEIVGVTWQTGRGFRWRLRDFAPRGEFAYPGEGWGLTHDGESLIMSDGTPQLRFLDPATFAERRRVTVTLNGRPLRYVNELELVKGELLANLWQSPLVARIDPATGVVRGFIDLGPLAAENGMKGADRSANGIAYDAKRDRLFVTGKNWRTLYEIKVIAE